MSESCQNHAEVKPGGMLFTGAVLDCPECGHEVSIDIEDARSRAPVTCPECGVDVNRRNPPPV